ncbi:MAG: hypothetical protein KAS73_07275, partial [Candidatus Sabulitectum sp.]|nr:hypothetical protein [Candidatus Sabulitectum sp.]
FGPWECLGPEGGAVYAPVQSPSDTQKIWALSDSDPAFVYYSSDAGATWANISSISGGEPIDMVVTADGSLCAVDHDVTWTSQNSGQSWSRHDLGSNYYIIDVVAHPTDANRVYGTGYYYSGGFHPTCFRSTDGGASFSRVYFDVGTTSFTEGECIAISHSDPSNIIIGGYSYISGTGYLPFVVRSTNGGSSFSLVSPPVPGSEYYVAGVAIHPTNPNILLAASFSKIYRSTNGGTSWTSTGNVSDPYSPMFSLADNNLVLIGSFDNAYRSANAGASWSSASTGLTGEEINHVIPDWNNSSIAYTSSTQGFFRSTNGGSSWSSSNSGLLLGKIVEMIKCQGYIYLIADDLGIYRKPSSGVAPWQLVTSPLSCGDYGGIATDGASVILALEGDG